MNWVTISRDLTTEDGIDNERELGDDEIEALIAAMVDDLREQTRLRQRLYERKYRQRVRVRGRISLVIASRILFINADCVCACATCV